MRRWSFVKGHGTENDFVLLLDRENTLALGPEEVRFLCDRRAGIGADGVLRAVPAHAIASEMRSDDPLVDRHGAPLWFMDYRNADGSIAEMCGNGVRVFARYLLSQDLVQGPAFEILTRAGVRQVEECADGRIRVGMGVARLTGAQVSVRTCDGASFAAVGVDVGNPHAVSFVADVPGLDLTALDLHLEPTWEPAAAFPDGVNREFVAERGAGRIAMRVFERGSGETRSCGTGTVAAALAARARTGTDDSAPTSWQVDVPGGSVSVELAADQAYLTGPAVLVAHGEVTLPAEGRLDHRLTDVEGDDY